MSSRERGTYFTLTSLSLSYLTYVVAVWVVKPETLETPTALKSLPISEWGPVFRAGNSADRLNPHLKELGTW